MSTRLAPSIQPWRSELLESLPGVAHAVTRRVVGMGVADGNVGFGSPRDRADAWAMRQRWCAAAGFDPGHLVTLGQIHGTDVHLVTAGDAGRGAAPGSPQIGLGDALITNTPGPVLMTLHADCQPIFLVDPGRRGHPLAIAVVHAGWRGTVADAVGATLATMTAAFGTRPQDVHASLGPAIQSCCYDVGEEVATAWRDRAGAEGSAALAVSEDRVRFSLTAANLHLVRRAGISAVNIERSPVCTRCDGEHWFSHRGQGPHTGRFGAMIAIANNGATW
jgi:polyphenol oxidase